MNQGRLVGQIRAGGGCRRVVELSKIPLEGLEQKRGEGKQRFLKGGSKLGQGVGALKGGTGSPLRTMTNLLTAKCQTKKNNAK